MSPRTLLAVPITSAEPPLAGQIRAARAAGADLVELRVDCIGNVGAVAELLAGPHELPMIVTIRPAAEGGEWTGDEAERIALLERLGRHGPGYIDVEYAAWQSSAAERRKIGEVAGSPESGSTPQTAELGHEASAAAGALPLRNRLIVSWHDFSGTPDDLDAIFDRLAGTTADVIKAALMARDATDALRVLTQLQRRAVARPTIGLAMGEAGLVSRVLARKLGAFLTFATLRTDQASAPGQPTVAELRGRYRWESIGPGTRVYGVVGWPVGHSLSPHVHNAALATAGIDAVYVPLPVRPDEADFGAFMECVVRERGLGIAGLSVTIPHKEHALRWLDRQGLRVSDLARRCGAVNTLTVREDGRWEGDNTDARGALAALQGSRLVRQRGLRGLSVDVLGAGGAARAVVAALGEQGCAVTVYNRTPQRAEALARELRCAWKPWDARRQVGGDVLINCTSVGLWPAVDESPVPDDALRPEVLVMDTVYRPAQTRLLRAASARGCEVISGVSMFLAQAAAQHELWHPVKTSATSTLDAMRAELRSSFGLSDPGA